MSDGLSENYCAREVSREGMRELHVTCPGDMASEICATAADVLQTAGAQAVFAEFFGPAGSAPCPALPLTWVLPGQEGPGLGGLYAKAVAGVEVRPLELDGVLVGTMIDGPHATECMLAGVYATDTSVPNDQQARATFERIEHALALVDMDFSNVARTWLFLDDILSWYGDFNRVRTGFFNERGVFDGVVPASTGIGGSNPQGAAMVTGAYAVRPKSPAVTVQVIPSPLQCPAPAYGSSFSRAVEVAMPDVRRVFISGTASIAPGGETVHIGDVLKQTERTCEVVHAILDSRGMGWDDVTRATAYVRHAADAGVFEQFRSQSGMPVLPVVVAHNVICRDDLLFELEVDAVQAQ